MNGLCRICTKRDGRVGMKENRKKLLSFPARPEEPAGSSMIIFELGGERVAIRWEIEELPPAAPVIAFEQSRTKRGLLIRKKRTLGLAT